MVRSLLIATSLVFSSLSFADVVTMKTDLVQNGDFENGMEHWDTYLGNVNADSGFLKGGLTTAYSVDQNVSLASINKYLLSSGELSFLVDFQQGSYISKDKGRLAVAFKDVDGNVLSVIYSPSKAPPAWSDESIGASIPINAHTMTINLYGTRSDGSYLDVYFDNISFSLQASSDTLNKYGGFYASDVPVLFLGGLFLPFLMRRKKS
tara:strand:- start:401 stop:1021 length:621 start_codon:yes stop_codon:yes gene_type:complete